MRNIVYLLLIFSSISGLAQTSYEISGFSNKYKGKLTIEKGYESEVFKKGEISIIEIKTNRTIINIQSDELAFELDEAGKVRTNIMELPYGEQSIIIHRDFNFDGNKDFAIMDGQFSCYHGPSFQIYLETDKGLVQSPEFTELAQEYCGMFNVNEDNQTISTMTKSGCCWHQYTEFEVIENIPVEKKSVEIGLNTNGILLDYIESEKINGNHIEKKYSTISEDADIILVHSIQFENGKEMRIYRAFQFDDILFYVFTDADKHIEFYFDGNFVYDSKRNTLTFFNNDTEYKIEEDRINVKMPIRSITMKATSYNKNTNLSSLKNLKINNLKIK